MVMTALVSTLFAAHEVLSTAQANSLQSATFHQRNSFWGSLLNVPSVKGHAFRPWHRLGAINLLFQHRRMSA
jgi:hypothetical protein